MDNTRTEIPPNLERAKQKSKTLSALVYDRKLGNPRATFSMKMSLDVDDKGVLNSTREWFCIGDNAISTETLEWSPMKGIHRVSMHNLSLGESAQMCHADQHGDFELCSPKTQQMVKVKRARFNTTPATLLSLPFEVAKNWQALKSGKRLIFDYSVLKVQAHTKVSLQGKVENGFLVVKLTPLSWLWRWVFGSSYLYFDESKPVLRKIDGLIEPRDTKPNGRYLEYLARLEFEEGVDLTDFVFDAKGGAKP